MTLPCLHRKRPAPQLRLAADTANLALTLSESRTTQGKPAATHQSENMKGWRRIRLRKIFIGQSIEWFTNGTSQGPLLVQVLATLEEMPLGFLIGSMAGIVCGIVLGRNKLLSDVFSLYIQIAGSIPRAVLAADYLPTNLERRY